MWIRKKFVLGIILGLCLLTTVSCMNLTNNQKKYYEDTNNYISITGVIEYLKFDDSNRILYLQFSEMDEKLDDNCFKIVDENYSVIVRNGAKDSFEIGQQVTFTTAPKYFGNGYVMPIVKLSIDNEVLLDFETGYENLLNWLYE